MPVELQVLEQKPPEVYDNSTLSTHQRCPRKGFYQYVTHRAPAAKNYPISFGVAYHKFREVLDELWLKEAKSADKGLDNENWLEYVFLSAWSAATRGWEDPPSEHYKSYLTEARLKETCVMAFDRWQAEKRKGRFKVIQTEHSFTLPLPSGALYGGRFDQIIEWNRRLWVRDFKTTSRMGKNYALQFDPDNQITGYVWGAQELSGRPVQGAIMEVVYNTKTKGPQFHQFLSTRTEEHIEHWTESVESDITNFERHIEEGVWPMRTVACNDYGGCYYRGCCKSSGWGNIEDWLLSETIHSVWDFTNPDEEEGVVD